MRQFQSKVSKTRLLSLSKSANRWTSTLHQRRHRDFCCRLRSDQPRQQHLLGVNAITASRSEELMGSSRNSKGGLCHRATARPILATVTVRVLIVRVNRPTLDSQGWPEPRRPEPRRPGQRDPNIWSLHRETTHMESATRQAPTHLSNLRLASRIWIDKAAMLIFM